MDALRIFLDGANRNRTLFVLLVGFALFPIYTGIADLPFWNDLAMRIMLLGLAAMGLNLVLGYGGMVSFGHAAFVGVGAYCVGISQYYGLFNGWIHILMALGACGALGLVIGYLALLASLLRFCHVYFAVAHCTLLAPLRYPTLISTALAISSSLFATFAIGSITFFKDGCYQEVVIHLRVFYNAWLRVSHGH